MWEPAAATDAHSECMGRRGAACVREVPAFVRGLVGQSETEMVMKVMEIWRYPVKTMAGEKLQRARLGPLGIDGDRVVHVEDIQCRVNTSRSHPRFLGHKGTLDADGAPLVDGRPWNNPQVAAEVVDIAGAGAKLVRYDGAERFDVLPLLVATDGAIAAFGHDHRRLRPNIVIMLRDRRHGAGRDRR